MVDADFEALLKTHPDDLTAVLLVAQNLRTKMAAAPVADQAIMRDRLIGLYDTAFKTTEDIPTRFVLAGLYHDKQDYKSAYKQYAMVIKLLAEDPPYDLNTRQKELGIRNQLLTGLNGLPAASVPEAASAIADQSAKIPVLTEKIKIDQAKQDEDRRKQAEIQKNAQAKAAQDAKDAAAAKLKSNSTVTPGSSGGSKSAPSAPGSIGSSSVPVTIPPAPAASGSSGASSPGAKK